MLEGFPRTGPNLHLLLFAVLKYVLLGTSIISANINYLNYCLVAFSQEALAQRMTRKKLLMIRREKIIIYQSFNSFLQLGCHSNALSHIVLVDYWSSNFFHHWRVNCYYFSKLEPFVTDDLPESYKLRRFGAFTPLVTIVPNIMVWYKIFPIAILEVGKLPFAVHSLYIHAHQITF